MYIPDWISSRGFFMKSNSAMESPSQDACPFMVSKLKSHLDF